MTEYIIQPRMNTAAGAADNNRVLAMGERGFETDTRRWKTGDGETNYNDLLYDDDPDVLLPSASVSGKTVLTGTPTQARTAIGAGTSDLTLGTTNSTAKPGDWQPAAADISGVSESGATVLTGTPEQARTAIGAEVAGATKDMDDITDATAVGRAVARAVDAANARAAIGAAAAGTDLTLVAGQNIDLNTSGGNLTISAVHSPRQGIIPSIDRALASDVTVPTGTGNLVLSYFTARRSGNYSKIRVKTGDTGAAATPTLVRFALFTVASNWGLTRVAVTANDTTLLAAPNTVYEKALPSSYSAVGGTWYALGVLVVSAAAAPTLVGKIMPDATEAFLDPRLCGVIDIQTDIQSAYPGGSVDPTTGNPYIVLVP